MAECLPKSITVLLMCSKAHHHPHNPSTLMVSIILILANLIYVQSPGQLLVAMLCDAVSIPRLRPPTSEPRYEVIASHDTYAVHA